MSKTCGSNLLKDKRFKINEDYYQEALKNKAFSYKIKKIKCSDIKIRYSFGKKIRNLSETEAYQYLKGDKSVYDHAPVRFDNLIKSLEESGYDKKFITLVDEKNILLDGRHRTTWLMSKYGDDFELEVLEISKVKINIFIKLLINLIPIKKMRKKLREQLKSKT